MLGDVLYAKRGGVNGPRKEHRSLGELFLDGCELDHVSTHIKQLKPQADNSAYYYDRVIRLPSALILYR